MSLNLRNKVDELKGKYVKSEAIVNYSFSITLAYVGEEEEPVIDPSMTRNQISIYVRDKCRKLTIKTTN